MTASPSGSAVAKRRDCDITILKNGDIQFVEKYEFQFTGGPFSTAYRGVYLDKDQSVTDFQVSGNGKAYLEGTGQVANTFQLYQEKGQQFIKWFYPPTTNASRSFALRYTIRGALRLAEGEDQFWWNVIERDHGYPIQSAMISVQLPALFSGDQIKAQMTSGQGNITIWNGQTIVFTANGLAEGDGLEIRVQFPHGAVR